MKSLVSMLWLPLALATLAAAFASCATQTVAPPTGGEGGDGGTGGAPMPTCNCPDDSNSCTLEECADSGECIHKPDYLMIGKTCNGDEKKVCSKYSECRWIDGIACILGKECQSGFCADGVCCDAACDGQCQACNLSGSEGKCITFPDGSTDMDCAAGQGCSAGKCATGKFWGETCAADAECLNKACVAGACRLQNGLPCVDPAQCVSNFCDAQKLCAAPTTNADCKSGEMLDGVCVAAPGQPCDADLTCSSISVCTSAGVCGGKAGTLCTSGAQCGTQFCGTGGLCAACAQGDCQPCSFGVCTVPNFPAGAYCRKDSSCAAGLVCLGFPATCQPPPP